MIVHSVDATISEIWLNLPSLSFLFFIIIVLLCSYYMDSIVFIYSLCRKIKPNSVKKKKAYELNH